MVPLLLEGPSGIILILSLPLKSASYLVSSTLFISKLCLCPLPGSETLLGGLCSPVLDPTQLSPSPGGTCGTSRSRNCHPVGCRRDWLCFTASNFLLMQGQQPIFALQAPSCSCMHFRQPAHRRDVTAGPVLSLFYLISPLWNLN